MQISTIEMWLSKNNDKQQKHTHMCIWNPNFKTPFPVNLNCKRSLFVETQIVIKAFKKSLIIKKPIFYKPFNL